MNIKLYNFFKILMKIALIICIVKFVITTITFLFIFFKSKLSASLGLEFLHSGFYNIFLIIILHLFLNFLNEIENARYLDYQLKTPSKISKAFLMAAIIEFILNTLVASNKGILMQKVELNMLTIIFIFNYITFSIIPILVKKLVEINEDNKSII